MLLHQLINALTKQEKKSFYLHISSKESAYVDLYKIYTKQKIFDQKKIKSTFSNQHPDKNFDFIKSYLYHAILRTCVQSSTSKKDTQYYLMVIKLLFEKGLYKNCAKFIKSAFREAENELDYLSMIKVIEYARQLVYSNVEEQSLNEIIKKQNEIINKLKIVSSLSELYIDFINVTKYTLNSFATNSQLKSVQKIKDKVLKFDSSTLDLRSGIYYHLLLFKCSEFLKDLTAIECELKHLQLIVVESFDKNFIDFKIKLNILDLLIRHFQNKCEYDIEQEYIDLLLYYIKKEKNYNLMYLINAKAYVYNIQLYVFLLQRKIHEALKIEEILDSFLKRKKSVVFIHYVYSAIMFKIILRFILGEHRETLRYIEKIEAVNKQEAVRKDYIITVVLIKLVIAFEQQKMGLVESRLNAFNYQRRKYKMQGSFFDLFASFFNNVLQNRSVKKEAISLYNSLKKLNHTEDFIYYFYFVDWVRKLKSGERRVG